MILASFLDNPTEALLIGILIGVFLALAVQRFGK